MALKRTVHLVKKRSESHSVQTQLQDLFSCDWWRMEVELSDSQSYVPFDISHGVI